MIRLIEKAAGIDHADKTLTLPFDARQKSRQRVLLDCGTEAALLLPPGTSLGDGDVLRSEDGVCVRVRAAAEEVSIARGDDPRLLARACYHLGNRHVPVQIAAGSVAWLHDHVLDDMVRSIGLDVVAEHVAFEPEPGAYHGARSHEHSHAGHEH